MLLLHARARPLAAVGATVSYALDSDSVVQSTKRSIDVVDTWLWCHTRQMHFRTKASRVASNHETATQNVAQENKI